MMADTIIYSLACTARSKLCREALSGEVDLRRVIGHAKVLDYLTAELVKFGYGWDTDDKVTVLEENETVTPRSHVAGGIDASCTSESSEMESAESSDQSDSGRDSDSGSDSDSDSAESWKGGGEGEGDYEGSYGEYVDLSTAVQISRVYSRKAAAIQVSVLEVDEFDD